MPKLSVIVPVYNTEKYLSKCLNSLINQTLDDIEIIVVNDGSTDNSKNIIEDYCKKYPNKVFGYDKENGGLSDTRNYGIKKASGQFIGFVDSDDYVEANMYEEMYNIAIQDDLDFVECDFSWDYKNKSKKDIGACYRKLEDYYMRGRVMACNKIYKTTTILDNNILFPYGLLYEDVEFFYKLIPNINKSSHINKVFYHYVQRDNSIINLNGEKTEDIFIILENLVNYYKSKNIFDNYKAYLEYLYIRLLLGSSFLRITKINNKNIRKKLINKTYTELSCHFPAWKNNRYLNNISFLRKIYFKSINSFTCKIYSAFFRIFLRSQF